MDIFDFTFVNRAGFLLAFIPGLFNLLLVIYILLFLPRNRLTNLFALFTLSLALWQFDDTAARICTSAAAADIWDCIFSPAWILLGSLCLHFCLLYSRVVKDDLFRFFIALIYIPGFIFTGIYQSHLNPHIFLYAGRWGWRDYYNGNLADELMIWWISILVTVSCCLLVYKTWKVRKDPVMKAQSLLITAGITIPTAVGIITQLIWPILLNKPAVPVTSTFMTFFSLGTAVALTRYRLFGVSELISGNALVEALPVIVFSVSENKRLTYLNRYGREILDLADEDIHQLDFDEVFTLPSDDSRFSFGQVLQRALSGEHLHNMDLSLLTSKGMVDIIASASPIVNNYKIQGVLFAARNVTELKRSHEMVRRNEGLLKEAQAVAHIGSWEWDVVTDTVLWSDELYRIYGVEPGQPVSRYDSYIDKIHPEDREAADKIIRRAFIDHLPFEFYHRLIIPGTDQVRLVQARGRVTVNANGDCIRMNGTGQDVTLMKESEERLRKQNIELQKIYSELDQFVYRVSHDLRSPLTSMDGLIGIAISETSDPTMLQYLELLKGSVEEQDKFIRDIIDHFRNNKVEPRHEAVDISELLNPIIDHQKKLHHADDTVDVQVHIRQHVPLISDRNRLRIIFKNLISNALIFTDREKGKAKLDIIVEVTAGKTTITVADNGIGIGEEQQERVYDMFYRGSKRSVGSGLGLYIVRDAVQKLGGVISFSSDPGRGTRFTVELPNDASQARPA